MIENTDTTVVSPAFEICWMGTHPGTMFEGEEREDVRTMNINERCHEHQKKIPLARLRCGEQSLTVTRNLVSPGEDA